MYRSSRQGGMKAQAGIGLILLFLIFLTGITILLMVGYMVANGVIDIRNTVSISMEVDDRGTELLSLMNVNNGDDRNRYIMLLGDMIAANTPLDTTDEITATLDRMHDFYIMRLQYSGMSDKVFSNGNVSEGDEYRMEIPVPGAQPGKIKAYVKLER
jgi:hypothetical protein